MRLRSLTISENPTCSSREARRSTVGEVVTVWIRFLPTFVRGKADYSLPIGPIPNVVLNHKDIKAQNSFSYLCLGAFVVKDSLKS